MTHLTVALSGLDEADVECVRDVLERDELISWRLADDTSESAAEPDLLIVDVDSVWGHMDWLKSTGRGQRTAGYSTQPQAHAGELALAKPLSSDDLAQVLCTVADAVSGDEHQPASFVPTEETVAATPPAPGDGATQPEPFDTSAAEVFPADGHKPHEHEPATATDIGKRLDDTLPAPPEESEALPDTIAEWLLSDTAHECFALHDGALRLLVDPQRGVYHGGSQLKPLITLLRCSPETARTPDASELAMLDEAGQPVERLLWLAALIATPGRLSTHHDSTTSFRLERWPQIEREFPRHFRIATAMMKQPGSLGELASAANTPQADVADFINAYAATGHVVASDAEPAVTSGGRPRLRKLFARSANR